MKLRSSHMAESVSAMRHAFKKEQDKKNTSALIAAQHLKFVTKQGESEPDEDVFEVNRRRWLLFSNEGAVAIDRLPGVSVKYYGMLSAKTGSMGASRDVLEKQRDGGKKKYVFID